MAMNAAQAVLGPPLAQGLGEQLAMIGRRDRLTYRQVQEEAGRCANALRAMDIVPGQRVLLLLRDSPALVCAYLGVMAAGAVAVTLNLRSSEAELAFVLRDSQPVLALVDPEYLPLWRGTVGGTASCPVFTLGGVVAGIPAWEVRVAEALPAFDPMPVAGTDMAFWIYTSGTTGEMKACVHRHQDVLLSDAYLRETLGVTAGMRVFATSKLFFAYALGTCLFGAMRLGATTILLDAWPTPDAVARVIAQHQPHVVFSVPAFYRAMLAADVTAQPAFRKVGTWVSAGERLPATVFQRWHAATGAPIVEGMGTSETIYMILTQRPGAAVAGSSGKPAPGVEARLVDMQGQSVAANTPGILHVRMSSISAGYWNQPERSAQVFRDGWFNTGDVFTVDGDGLWRHGGRQEDRIPVPGGSVNPADIEESVQALPGVADACLVSVPSGLTVFAVETTGADRASLALAIHDAVEQHLPPPIPAPAIRWVSELPRTASGKVQRYRLRQA
ncbi:MAG TPA: AMP-binding protein [bacterium]